MSRQDVRRVQTVQRRSLQLAQDAAQSRLGAVAQQMERGRLAVGWQPMDRATRLVGCRDRNQPIRADNQARAPGFVQRSAHARVAVGEHDLRLALKHERFALLLHVGDELDGTNGRLHFQRTQPAWHEGERQRVRRGEAQRRRAGLGNGAGFTRDASDFGLQILRDLSEPLAHFGQLSRLRAAVEQVDPEPLFQGAHAAAERRLRHVALVGRAREVAAGRQRREVVEPREVHGHGGAFKASKTR